MPAIVYLLFAIPGFILFSWTARRLLGVTKLSMTKTVLAALGGLLVADVLARVLVSRDLSQDQAILIGLVVGLVSTMIIIITFEAFAHPDRSPIRSKVSNPVAVVQQNVAGFRRSAQIARIANSHGLSAGFGLAMGRTMSPEEATEYGVHLRDALEEAGGVFVKLGQLLATRPDIIPQETADELAELHQDVEPAPQSEVEPALSAAFGQPVDQIFADFDWSPIGAGSLGQVYRATLVTGEEVVVKARRPNIQDDVNRDLQIAINLATFTAERSSQAEQLGVVSLAEQFSRQLRDEMDYRIEARNTVECRAALAQHGLIEVPIVFDDLSGETVLVISLLKGDTLGRHGVIGGERGRELADVLFESEVDAMLSGERFHADPHPGNVMVMPDGNLGLIDFGSADRLDAYERAAVTEILSGLALNDPTMLRSAALTMGMGDGDVDPAQLDRAFARLMVEHLGPGAEPSAALIQDFITITNEFGMVMPTAVTGMLRALATLQGSVEVLSPGYPMITAAKKVAKEEMLSDLKPENLTNELKREVIHLAPVLRKAPHHLDRIAGQIEQGKLAFRVRMFSDENDIRVISRLINRGILAFVAATLGVVSAMLIQIPNDHLITDNVGLLQVLGFVGLFAGSILIMRVVLEILRER